MLVQAFVKKEGLVSPSDPRVISNVDSNHNLRASQYTYAVKEQVLKHLFFYCVGMTPRQIASRVASFCSVHNGNVFSTDFSRFDATIGP